MLMCRLQNPSRALEFLHGPARGGIGRGFMHSMSGIASRTDDSAFVGRLSAGDPDAEAAFFRRVRDVVWTVCRLGSRDDEAARHAYEVVRAGLKADGFGRLRPFRGGQLEKFVAIVAREILIDHILRLPREGSDRRWLSFEALFKRQIMSVIARFCPDRSGPGSGSEPSAKQMDVYQRVCITLAKDDCRILRSYSAQGKLARSLRTIVANAAIDQQREEEGRPTLPAAVEDLSPLDKLVFKAIYWERQPQDAAALLSVLAARAKPGLTRADVEAAVRRVRAAVGPGYVRRSEVALPEGGSEGKAEGAGDLAGQHGEAEAIERENEILREQAIEAMMSAVARLPEREQFFVRMLLEGSNRTRREHFGEDNYKLQRRVKAKLLKQLGDEPAVSRWLENIAR
jgi:DNA-directed RNA polymerase specialized sigma24 family protein